VTVIGIKTYFTLDGIFLGSKRDEKFVIFQLSSGKLANEDQNY
jgi:hypothetical protein